MVDIIKAVHLDDALIILSGLHMAVEGDVPITEDSPWGKAKNLLMIESRDMLGKVE